MGYLLPHSDSRDRTNDLFHAHDVNASSLKEGHARSHPAQGDGVIEHQRHFMN